MKKLLLISTVLMTCMAMAADQPQIKNAKVEQRSGGSGIEQQVRSVSGTAWIGYSEPVIAGEHNMCCYSSHEGRNCCGGCGLEHMNAFSQGKPSDCRQQQQL